MYSSIKRFRAIKRLGTNVKQGSLPEPALRPEINLLFVLPRAPAGNRAAAPRRDQGQESFVPALQVKVHSVAAITKTNSKLPISVAAITTKFDLFSYVFDSPLIRLHVTNIKSKMTAGRHLQFL